jgi:hypothetical protein
MSLSVSVRTTNQNQQVAQHTTGHLPRNAAKFQRLIPIASDNQHVASVAALRETKMSSSVAAQDLGILWGRFYAEHIFEKIPNKLSSEIYAIYTYLDEHLAAGCGTSPEVFL